MSIITSETENGILTIHFSGRVDSTTAPQAEAGADAALSAGGYTSVVVDAEKLEYISSAGLRVLLKIRKSEPTLRIVNASTEVYEILEMTGFTEMIPVEKAYRRFSVDGCPVIGKGAQGIVYRYDGDTIVKVYYRSDCLPEIKKGRELARRAFVLGIPTAISYDIVKVGESFGVVFELIDAKSYSQLISENPGEIDRYVTEYAQLLRKIHRTEVNPDEMPDIKKKIFVWCDDVAPYLPPAEGEKLKRLVRETPDTLNMLHVDYHTNNVMAQNGEPLLIDMDSLSHGHPVFELANIYITYVGFGEVDPSIVEKFLGMPYEVTKSIWEKFLPVYLDTADEEKIRSVEDKAKLISYVRFLRHTMRHGGDTEEAKATVGLCIKRIGELLPGIDSLDS